MPDESFMAQVARNLTDMMESFLVTKQVLICDRDDKFTEQVKKAVEDFGVRVVVTPCQAPNCNAHAERFVRSIKEECLHHMILFGERNFLRCLRGITAHFHAERNHQGIGNELIDGGELAVSGPVECQEGLGGLLKYYRRAA